MGDPSRRARILNDDTDAPMKGSLVLEGHWHMARRSRQLGPSTQTCLVRMSGTDSLPMGDPSRRAYILADGTDTSMKSSLVLEGHWYMARRSSQLGQLTQTCLVRSSVTDCLPMGDPSRSARILADGTDTSIKSSLVLEGTLAYGEAIKSIGPVDTDLLG